VLPHCIFNYGHFNYGHFNYEVLVVLSFTCVVLLVLSGPGSCWPCSFASSGGFRRRLCRSFAVNERNHNR